MERHRDAYRAVRTTDPRWTLTSIATGWFLTLGARYLLPAVLPQVKETFEIDNATAGLAITGIWLGYGLMQFPTGLLVERFGERTLVSASLGLAGGSLWLVGAAPIFPVFFVACCLFGVTTGLYGTTRGIALSRIFTSNTGRAFGITFAAGSIGSAAFPYLGNLAAEVLGWQLGVTLTVPLFFLVGTSAWMTLPERKSTGGDQGPLLTNLVRMLRALVTDRSIAVAFLASTIVLFVFQGLTAFLPTYLGQQKSLGQGNASLLFAALFVAGAGFQLVGGRAVDRYGTRLVTVAMTSVGVLTLVALPFVEGLIPLTLVILVLASRVALPSVLNPYIIDQIPEDLTGTGWGLLRTLFFVFGATGSTVVGALADRGLFDEAFYLLAALTAVTAVLLAFLPPRSDAR